MQHRSRRAFTIIELMVVITIIGILAALTLAGVKMAINAARVKATQTLIDQVASAMASYQSQFGEYPPTSYLSVQPGGQFSGTNSGIESLVQCLTTLNNGGPFIEFKDEMLANVDGDQRPVIPANPPLIPQPLSPSNSQLASNEMFELVDDWGNPIVYARAAEYDPLIFVSATLNRYMSADGQIYDIPGIPRSAVTGVFYNPQSFVIWSIGPNGINENGGGDDIANWKY